MADGINMNFTDNSADIIRELTANKAKALEVIGLLAEGYAKRACAVDTGRLRNSITHSTSTNAGVGTYSDNHGNSFADATAKTTPNDDAVFIGTNVEYGPYVELGTVRTPAQPFLKPAASDHIEQYKEVVKKAMKGQL